VTISVPNSFRLGPDERGRFGLFGGRFVAETLMPLILDLERHYEAAKTDPAFRAEFDNLLTHYVGRPSPLYFAERLTDYLRAQAMVHGKDGGGAKIYFKREELNHTGAHKINNVLGQILLARRMGKRRIIAETGAGQHGVATATACARFGLECIVYMGAVDVERQKPNVYRMNMLGAKVVPVQSGARTLKDATPIRPWSAISNASSATRPSGRCRPSRGGSRIRCSPASAAAPMRSAFSIRSSMIRPSRSSGSRPPATDCTTSMPPRWPAAVPACCTATAPIC
jgi:hypothetical protein